MERMYRIAVLCILLSSSFALNVQAAAPSDVAPSHPNYQAISSLLDQGVLQGYPDGSVKPNQAINRVEALKLVMRSSGFDPYWYITHVYYYDVERGSWYEPYVAAATDHGLVQGYSDGNFRPKQGVTSPELLSMLLRSKQIQLDSTSTMTSVYDDVPANAWYAPLMAYAKNRNILPQTPMIYPTKSLTRGEASELIYRFRQHLTDTSATISQSSSNSDAANIYTIPADSHIIPPTFGETEARQEAINTNMPLPANYQQPTVVSPNPNSNEFNWWPVYNVSERLQNNMDMDPLHQIFGPIQIMNAWNFANNVSQEVTRYSQDHLNYTYSYADPNQPGTYIYTGQ